MTGPSAPETGAETVADLRPVPVPDIEARRLVFRGTPAWVLRNRLTERYVRVHPRLHALIGLLDGQRSVGEAIALLPPAAADAPGDTALLQGVASLLGQGLLRVPGRRMPPRPRPAGALPFLRRFAFTRFDLFDLGRSFFLMRPLLGWLFTKPGALLWAALVATAAGLWIARAPDVAESLRGMSEFGALDAVQAYVVFTLLKILHEAGHALAAQRMAAAEGVRLSVFRCGFSFMFLMPAPFVDVSSVWMVANPWRRALVGAAGIYVEGLIAAVAAILWAFAAPGWGREVLFQTVLVVGVSSLLFNANPLVKLDGYYVASDLLGLPNLQTHAVAASRKVLRSLFAMGGGATAAEWRLALWFSASMIYRWTIYLGIIWIALGLHWTLAVAAAALVLALFVLVPAVQAARALAAQPGPALAAGALTLGLGAAALLVPLPDRVTVSGIAERDGTREVFAGVDGMLTAVATPGSVPAGTEILTLRNPDLLRSLQQLELEVETLALERRRAAAEDPRKLDGIEARMEANLRQTQEMQAEIARWHVLAPAAATWSPMRANALEGAWLRRDDREPLGVLVPRTGPLVIRLVLDQQAGPAILKAVAEGDVLALRIHGGGPASFTARIESARPEARGELPSPALSREAGGPIATRTDGRGRLVPAERIFELRLRPEEETALRHGMRVDARITLPPSPLAEQLWRAAQQALQRRLAV